MNSYLLDTNTCIYFLNKSSDRIISRFQELSPLVIKLPAITVAELFFGAEKSKAKKRIGKLLKLLFQILRSFPSMRTAARSMQ